MNKQSQGMTFQRPWSTVFWGAGKIQPARGKFSWRWSSQRCGPTKNTFSIHCLFNFQNRDNFRDDSVFGYSKKIVQLSWSRKRRISNFNIINFNELYVRDVLSRDIQSVYTRNTNRCVCRTVWDRNRMRFAVVKAWERERKGSRKKAHEESHIGSSEAP